MRSSSSSILIRSFCWFSMPWSWYIRFWLPCLRARKSLHSLKTLWCSSWRSCKLRCKFSFSPMKCYFSSSKHGGIRYTKDKILTWLSYLLHQILGSSSLVILVMNKSQSRIGFNDLSLSLSYDLLVLVFLSLELDSHSTSPLLQTEVLLKQSIPLSAALFLSLLKLFNLSLKSD